MAPHIRFGVNVSMAEFDSEHGVWQLNIPDGRSFEGRAVIGADGLLANANFPDIPGIDTFANLE